MAKVPNVTLDCTWTRLKICFCRTRHPNHNLCQPPVTSPCTPRCSPVHYPSVPNPASPCTPGSLTCILARQRASDWRSLAEAPRVRPRWTGAVADRRSLATPGTLQNTGESGHGVDSAQDVRCNRSHGMRFTICPPGVRSPVVLRHRNQ